MEKTVMEEKIYQTDKGEIHYWTNTLAEERLTLIFLPGLTADHRLFDMQMEYFHEKYNLLVWDAPGHFKSRPFELTFSLKEKADYLYRIIKIEGIVKPVIIGQSMGGYVAQCVMQNHPDLLSGFISIDSAPLKRKYVTAAELWLLKRIRPLYQMYPWGLLKKSGTVGCACTDYGQQVMLEMMETYEKNEYCGLAAHGFKILAEAMELDLPYEITCPCCLICGEKDKAGSAKRYNRKWTQTEGIRLYWIKNAGHNSNTDAPQEVNEIIQKFVYDIEQAGN